LIVGASQLIVIVFGLLVSALSIWGIWSPARLLSMVGQVMHQPWGVHAGFAARILLGAALLICAAESRFPLVFRVLGWIALVAAVALEIMGRERLLGFIAFFDRISAALVRSWLLLGVAFGVFLIYGIS
jgi:hypothetical protein